MKEYELEANGFDIWISISEGRGYQSGFIGQALTREIDRAENYSNDYACADLLNLANNFELMAKRCRKFHDSIKAKLNEVENG